MRTRLVRGLGLTMAVAAALAVGSCGGGGGGGSTIIPAFDLQVGVIATDLDGDGRVDVAVANTHVAGPPPHTGSVRVHRDASAGGRSFLSPVRYDVGSDPWGLVAADVTDDGVPDLVDRQGAPISSNHGCQYDNRHDNRLEVVACDRNPSGEGKYFQVEVDIHEGPGVFTHSTPFFRKHGYPRKNGRGGEFLRPHKVCRNRIKHP